MRPVPKVVIPVAQPEDTVYCAVFGTAIRTVCSTVPCSAPRAVPSIVVRTVSSAVTPTVSGGLR